MQPLFESWSLSRPPVPPRSKLYSLEPIGVGTELVESLTGYVARLAEAHAVAVGDLVGRLLSDLADPRGAIITPAAKASRVGGHGFRACSYALNGVSDRAAKLVHALETATSSLGSRVLELGGESGTDRNPLVYPGSYIEYVQRMGHEAPGIYT